MVNVVPRDLPRHNINHDTSSAFSNNVPLYTQTLLSAINISQTLEDSIGETFAFAGSTQTLPDATPLIGKIPLISKIVKTFEQIMQF